MSNFQVWESNWTANWFKNHRLKRKHKSAYSRLQVIGTEAIIQTTGDMCKKYLPMLKSLTDKEVQLDNTSEDCILGWTEDDKFTFICYKYYPELDQIE